MPHYLLQVSYQPTALADLISNPQDRTEALRPVLEKLGGKIETFFFAFGEYDVVAIVEMAENAGAAAFSLAASAGGAIKAIKTTPLMTSAEGIEALKRAATCGYKAPAAAKSRTA